MYIYLFYNRGVLRTHFTYYYLHLYTLKYACVHISILQQGSLEDLPRVSYTLHILLCTHTYTYVYLYILLYIFVFYNRGVLRTSLVSHTNCTYYYVHIRTLMYTYVQTCISTRGSSIFMMPHTHYVCVHLHTLVYTYAHLCTHMYWYNEWVWRTCVMSSWIKITGLFCKRGL